MISRTAGTNSLHTVASGRVMTAIAVVILFIAILLLGVRYAHGGAEVSSDAAVNTESMAADGGAAIIATSVTAITIAGLYMCRLAR